MALPPEPIEEVLPEATWVVEAEVTQVLEQAPSQPEPPRKPGFIGPGKAPRQVVRLKVRRVLRGENVPAELDAVKPEAGYALRQGATGPFLLDGATPTANILGRYGPDTWRVEAVEAALGR